MRRGQNWSPEMEQVLRRMRADGATWAAIGGALGLGRETVREQGRRLGVRRALPVFQPPPEDPNRPPLPPGHPLSWRLLIAGTCLEDAPYPYPVFF